jgi:hypothetical protein
MTKKEISERKFIIAAFAISFLLVAASWVWAFVYMRGIKQPLVVHFDSFTGINQIGSLATLTGMSITALVALAVDLLLAWEMEKRDSFLGKFLAGFALFFSLLIFLGFSAIISVNV